VSVLSYAAYVGYTWLRYGHEGPAADPAARDPLLDRFMPSYEVAERHHVHVNAPPEIVLAAAAEMDLLESPIIRTVFKGREWIMGSRPVDRRPRGLLAEVRSLGWGVLAEVPGREIVMGAVTQPWLPDVVFTPLGPDDFTAFAEPNYVKIAWTLRADPLDSGGSVFRTETRVATTDARSRVKFRRYWAFMSPGIILIRWVSLGPLKAEAERRRSKPEGPNP
jgi:hypothetical protein